MSFSCIISSGENDKGSGYVTFVKRLKNLTFKKAVRKCGRFAKKNAVMFVALIAAVVTSFFVPIDKEYLGYFDTKTLSCLFVTLAVVCALRNIKFFTILARKLVLLTGTLRTLFLMLICITFIGSMLIANDMALITFLPLGYFALSVTKKEKYMAYLFILQNISANLGGMLTPFGNPQNLYLYSYYNIDTLEFCSIMLKPFLLAITLLAVCCLFVKNEKLTINEKFPEKLSIKRTVLYLILFAISLLVVFRIVPVLVGLAIVFVTLMIVDRDALCMVDYPLLLTFVFFFIFAGNLARIDEVKEFFNLLLNKDTLLVSVLSCQFISNVPTAILLSQFTQDYVPLLIGVNIGGAGTLIASLASLITFSEYKLLYPKNTKKYLILFSVINFAFLIIMTVCSKLFFV